MNIDAPDSHPDVNKAPGLLVLLCAVRLFQSSQSLLVHVFAMGEVWSLQTLTRLQRELYRAAALVFFSSCPDLSELIIVQLTERLLYLSFGQWH